jgi:hypothetical protein
MKGCRFEWETLRVAGGQKGPAVVGVCQRRNKWV